ncbi:MAG: 50S ribosomal protein L10 [Patescibacteria group bacterium]
MAKTRQKKESLVAEVAVMLKDVKGAVFADFTGLTVKEMKELRKGLREQGIAYEVLKKTLLTKSIKEAKLENISVDKFVGSVSLAASSEDEVAPAKILVNFAKTHEKLKVLGGIMNRNFIELEQVLTLAKLPSKQELLGQLVGTIAAPVTGLVRVLSGNIRGLVQVLSTLYKKQA